MKRLHKPPKPPQNSSAIIHNTTSLEEVVSFLIQHGCKDLTGCIPTDNAPTRAHAYGGTCDVYKWELIKNNTTDTIPLPVAIKTLRCSGQSSAEARLLKRAAKELLTWSQLDHANILPLLGLAIFNGGLSMVSPWMSNGNLSAYLQKNKCSTADRIAFCEQTRAGLAYIHSKDMVHGDLKTMNIMVSDEGRCMIGDFGNAILKDLAISFAPTTTFGITHQYAPPEHLAAENTPVATKQSDVYSYGMTVLEILTGEIPFAGKNVIWIIGQASRGRLRPDRPSDIGDGIWTILSPCWAHDPSKRPPISNISFSGPISDRPKLFNSHPRHLQGRMREAGTSKVRHGVISGLKLASHVSMACATTSFYKKSQISTDGSNVSQPNPQLREEIVSIDDIKGLDRRTTSNLYGVPESLGHFHDIIGMTFHAEDLRCIWSRGTIRRMFVTRIAWYDNNPGSGSFLLLRFPSFIQKSDQWIRLERRPWNSGLKGAVSWISPLIKQPLADAVATISTSSNDLMTHEDMCLIPRETSEEITPLSFVLDIVDAVHKNCPVQSATSMSNDRLYLWIVMDAINRYHEPTTKDVNVTAQSNNPYRILQSLSHGKNCKQVARRLRLQEQSSS